MNIWGYIVNIGVIIGIISGIITISNSFRKKGRTKLIENTNIVDDKKFRIGNIIIVAVCYLLLSFLLYAIEVKVYGKPYYIQSTDYIMPRSCVLKHILIYVSFIAPIVTTVISRILMELSILDYEKSINDNVSFYSFLVFVGYNIIFWILGPSVALMMLYSNMTDSSRLFLLEHEKGIFQAHIAINTCVAFFTGYHCLNKNTIDKGF